MKRKILFAVALLATMTAAAQNIAAVSPSNATTIFQTLDEAIVGAESGSTIYLPGGGFQIKDETKINKKLTIMGVSHRGDTDNVDGATIISGNLHFEGGSSGSAVLGVYLTGNINVGTGTDSVTNFTVRYCNVNYIKVKHSQSSGMVVNQCYLRRESNFGNCNVRLENNIAHSYTYINGGIINHNIITSKPYGGYMSAYMHIGMNNTTITNNFFLASYSSSRDCSNCLSHNNFWDSSFSDSSSDLIGENPFFRESDKTWDDVFYANKGVSILSDYRLKGSWGKGKATDGTDIGIYGNIAEKKDLTPIPRIVSKKVDESTDGSGKLQIEVTVKAQ